MAEGVSQNPFNESYVDNGFVISAANDADHASVVVPHQVSGAHGGAANSYVRLPDIPLEERLAAAKLQPPYVFENDDESRAQENQPYVDTVQFALEQSKSKDDENEETLAGALYQQIKDFIPKPIKQTFGKFAAAASKIEKQALSFYDKATAPVNINARIRIAVAYFESQGWTQAQAIGITANLLRESGLNEHAVGDRGHAYGISQVHEDRLRTIESHFGEKVIESSISCSNYRALIMN